MTQKEEAQVLLPAREESGSRPSSSGPSPRAGGSKASTSGGAAPLEPKLGVCRICLEEESPANLEAPCSCTGTVEYVHHSCLQRWIEEKGDKVCELCKKPFEGEYEDPPLPLPRAQHVRVWGQEYLVVADPETGTVRAHRLQGLFGEEEEEGEERMPATTAWCFTGVLILLCMLLLKHLVSIFGRAPHRTGPAFSPPSQQQPGEPPAPPHGAADSAEADAAFEDLSVSLLVLWLLVRMLVMVVPLWSVASLRQRAFWRRGGGGEGAQGEGGGEAAGAGTQQHQLREVELERRLDQLILRMEAGAAQAEQQTARPVGGDAGVTSPLVPPPAVATRS